ncbi:MAG TPA: TIGR03905 family TSCPD domain-containing protein [Candidatus Pullichristensenella excrementigallinarum]|uniref:ribonucleoside-diphosphate reductase n=1 Tax=Candidatus Pullichristensenella excrementigallinarum TaxID=2840907 RepID=A0A9D1LB26_9FIRM|nr:TIGR03905 family TSCPD domain-containing protein [Candidatus Pullichristensenella excrementigallinarum]
MYTYNTRGTCSRQIQIELEEDTIKNVVFVGGCTGNLQGVSKLVQGMKVDTVIQLLQGIQCRGGTSCPDQLAKALVKIRDQRRASGEVGHGSK